METFFNMCYMYNINKFKSYYVVWKLHSFSSCVIFFFRLNRTMQYGNEEEECHQMRNEMVFKSYYVVWKRHPNISLKNVYPRLNRTMQYGNEKMEYIIGEGTPSLNRTMQYGNFFLTDCFFHSIFKFKSYYVVWKPYFLCCCFSYCRV